MTDRGGKGGADTVRRSRVRRSPVTCQLGAGSPQARAPREEQERRATRRSERTIGDRGWSQAAGWSVRDGAERQGDAPLDCNIQGKGTCAPGLEHPGRAEEKRKRMAPGAGAPDGGRRRTESSEMEQEGGDDCEPAKVAKGDGLDSAVEAKAQAVGLERRGGKKGRKPRTGGYGTGQGGKTATSIQGAIHWTAERRHRLVRTGPSTAARRRPTGLERPGDAGGHPWTGSSGAGLEGRIGETKATGDTHQGWRGRSLQGRKPQEKRV